MEKENRKEESMIIPRFIPMDIIWGREHWELRKREEMQDKIKAIVLGTFAIMSIPLMTVGFLFENSIIGLTGFVMMIIAFLGTLLFLATKEDPKFLDKLAKIFSVEPLELEPQRESDNKIS